MERLRYVKWVQLLNILYIRVTLEVLKLERSRLVKPVQFSNIPPFAS